MHPDELRAFARRDWAATDRRRLAYWAERFRREGGRPARRAATDLVAHARRLGVRLADAERRADDFDHHTRMRERLDRAARAFAGR
ncbi:MAG: hypothetical protein AB1635_08950 [Acidobacteriota bacterium]